MKITVEIPDEFIQSLVTKEWMEAKLKEYLGDNGENPDPELPKCEAGPEIRKITLLTDQRLQVNFWGIKVEEIKYTLYKDKKIVDTGVFQPKNDIPIINLKDKLTAGTYQLKFEGTLCKGENIREFIYNPTTPPPVPGKQTLETTFYYN